MHWQSVEEGRRFKTRLSAALNTHAYCSGEHIIVMALHFVIEGLVGFQLRLLRSGRVFGEMQCLSASCGPDTARSLTFTACAVMSPAGFWGILSTGQFPKTESMVRKALVLIKFRRCMAKIAGARPDLSIQTPQMTPHETPYLIPLRNRSHENLICYTARTPPLSARG